jgi:N-acetylmuramoyl-L-alanine amidase
VITPNSWDIHVAECTCYSEGSGAGDTAMLAIAYTQVNRARLGAAYAATHGKPHPLFGSGHLSEAALDPEQYSTFNRNTDDFDNLRRYCVAADSDPVVIAAATAVDAAISGSIPDPTRGATHYYDESVPAPSWTVGATPTLIVDKLHFFADVR